jgi:2-polyprenyl-3-methyl-5-hydroxy-6-metoxy-1,4-benzoquinol methylase
VKNSDTDRAAAGSAIFDRLASTWSRVHYSPQGDMVPRIARFSEALANLVPASARILDYGCGTGDIAAALAARGYRVDARDSSPAMVEKASTLHPGSGVRFAVVGTANADTVLNDETFDAVICSSVLEYLRDLPECLRLLSAALKPGGYLLATVPNIDHPARRHEAMHRALMSIAPLRSLVRMTPWGPSFELQWLSRNRMPVSTWIDLFHAAQFGSVWQDSQNHPLTLLIGRKET